MLALAAGESFGRPLWTGHRQTRSMVMVALVAAVAAAAAGLVAWVLGAPEPSTTGLAAATVLGAAAGVLFSLAAVHIGQRRVLRRAGKRS
jgi:peptidoglycan/LPS O-acetylase OafA/YrhL